MKFLLPLVFLLSLISSVRNTAAQQKGPAKKSTPVPKPKSNNQAIPNTGGIYQYANTNSFEPYHATVELSYTIETSHDTTITGPDKDYSHTFGSSVYKCDLSASCDTVFVQVRNTGGDTHYDCNWDVYDDGKPKDRKFKVMGNASYNASDIIDAYSDGVLYDGKNKHDVEEKWNLASISFDQNPMFNFKYDIDEGESKGKGDLSFFFKIDKAQGAGTKTENGNRQDMIGNPDVATQGLTKESYIAGLLQSGLNTNSLQGDLSNKGDGQYNSEGVARMGASDATIDKVQNGFIIEKDAAVNFNKGNVRWSVKYHIKAKLEKISNYEAMIAPEFEQTYNTWLPRGPELIDYPELSDNGAGNSINIKVLLLDKITHKPADKAFKATIKLTNSSKLPGYCMNFPENDPVADGGPDIRFDVRQKENFASFSDEKITTKMNKGGKFATIVSYDYGAYTDVTAEVVTEDGNTFSAHIENSTLSALLLPKRTGKSKIADYWKTTEKATDKSDDADDEKILDDDKHPGDGLTLYEEYRGFLENRKHFRGSTEKKDAMICDKIATNRSEDGIKLFMGAVNAYSDKLDVHYRFKDDEFGRRHDLDAGELAQMDTQNVKTPMKYDRCINYNIGKENHLVDQHGVVIMFADTALGYAMAVVKQGMEIGTPKNYYFLVIGQDFKPTSDGWSTVEGKVGDKSNIETGKAGSKIYTDEYARTLAHELLHCFNVHHHGDINDYGSAAFHYFSNEKKWFVYEIKINNISLSKLFDMNLYWEDAPGIEISANDSDKVQGRYWHVFGPQSTHSGVEDCIMRYDNSNAYTFGESGIYLVRGKYQYGELSGITLCNSTKGTGVNAPAHKPRPRYGDADAGRGDCIHQFCVSDR